MRVNTLFYSAVCLILPFLSCHAASYDNTYNNNNNNNFNGYNSPKRNSPAAEDNQTIIRQLRTTLSELKNTLNNHESEIRMFDNRLHNQEAIIDHSHQELTDNIQSQQETSKASVSNLEYKTDALDTTLKSIISDMRQMKTQSNEFVAILGQHKQKLAEFEKLMDAQNQHMKNLEIALSSMMEVMQAQGVTEKNYNAGDSLKEYKVQPGDSLEKIARVHKVSVQAIRDLNKLSKDKDRIFAGQTLKIPIN